ncbi:uncharacterized protein PV09_02032 [Verruconis gallopava]|uniref:F-box domain-containing protein n=1 Tax=Verruconis gallopava TaxID=253628 RepID=A0A0D2AJX8_9PEZI|nr:uncharacterized protein PV09_02032 [Verruconis gallopava]KIW07163.1 hypothetical protein PV09_02032 [Verruconis gallopava]
MTSESGESTMEMLQPGSPLLHLPAELIHQILMFLPPTELAVVSQTCRLLNVHAYDDRLWQRHLQSYLPHATIKTPAPSSSFRQHFLLHHPYWFIPKYKIWYSDTVHTGRLLIARYSARRQTIEAYALCAERAASKFEFWDWNPDVIIHTFEPRIQLDLNQPALKLDAETAASLPLRKRYSEEVIMDIHGSIHMNGLNTRLLLSRPLPPSAIGIGTQVWPPLKLPASERTRNASSNAFRGLDHKPSKMSELSQHTFRLRRWLDFTSLIQGMTMRVAEEVSTFATLPPESYTPTKKKPWRGIWCGDYSGHGCEFLLVLQPEEPVELPDGVEAALRRRQSSDSTESEDSWQSAMSTPVAAPTNQQEVSAATFNYEHLFEHTQDLNLINELTSNISAEYGRTPRITKSDDSENETSYEGQLMAVKLTGDPNVPRGEYTFIAPDISDAGLLRVANEEIFKGARVVKSVGHIAARDFRDDMYIPSQLILISHDTLAQYWEAFGHISFYKRVDIDKFVSVD